MRCAAAVHSGWRIDAVGTAAAETGGSERRTSRPPVIELVNLGVNGAARLVNVPVNRQTLAPFPPADRGDVAIEVRGDLLPGVQPPFCPRHCAPSIRPTEGPTSGSMRPVYSPVTDE